MDRASLARLASLTRTPRQPSTAGGVRGTVGIMSLAQANQDPRMQTAVENIVHVWQQWTGGTFNYFTLGANPLYQPWGAYANRWDIHDDK